MSGGGGGAPANAPKILKGHSARITALSADLTKIVTGSLDGCVKVWDTAGGLLHSIRFPPGPTGCPAEVSSIAPSHDAALVGLVDSRVFFLEFFRGRGMAAPREREGSLGGPPAAPLYDSGGGNNREDLRDLRIALRGASTEDALSPTRFTSPYELQAAYDSL